MKVTMTGSTLLLLGAFCSSIAAARECRPEWWFNRWHNDSWGCIYLRGGGLSFSGNYTTYHGTSGTFTNGKISRDGCTATANWREISGKHGTVEWTMEDRNMFQGHTFYAPDPSVYSFPMTKTISASVCPDY